MPLLCVPENNPLVILFENIYRQYLHCRRNKRNTFNALHFEVEQEKNLLALKEELETRTYRPSRSVCFFATKPKLREIFAADFRDRIVQTCFSKRFALRLITATMNNYANN